MIPERHEQFMTTFKELLRKRMFENSEFYHKTFAEMCRDTENVLKTGRGSTTGRVFRETCKALGIVATGMKAKRWVHGEPLDQRKTRPLKWRDL